MGRLGRYSYDSDRDISDADYRLYAERRANAIAELFGALMPVELKAIDATMFSLPAPRI
jgi:hypothetical protein